MADGQDAKKPYSQTAPAELVELVAALEQERDEARQRAGKLESLLERVSRQGKLFCWEWNAKSDKWTMHGSETGGAGEFAPSHSLEQLLERLHPDDRDRVVEAYERADRAGTNFELEYRTYLGADDWAHVREIGEAVHDEHGHLVGQEGIVQDITDLKRAEAALRDSRQEFQDLVESTSDWLWEMDADLRFTYISERFTERTGMDPSIILGRTRWEVAVARQDDELWRRHRSDLEGRRPNEPLGQ